MIILLELLLLATLIQFTAGFACGETAVIVASRISNGEDAAEGEWPWHGALYSRNGHGMPSQYRCGVTLIGARTVLTAAHCTAQGGIAINPDNVVVKFGMINRERPEQHVESYRVERIVRHERYNPKYFLHDIALLRTAGEVHFSDYIRPICLPGSSHKKKIESGHIVGWGQNRDERMENTLQHARVPVVNYTTCLHSNPAHFATVLDRNEESNFCVGGEDEVSACRGDSGGGLYQFQDQSWYIQGIISTGSRPDAKNHGMCNSTQYVTVTNTSYFREWIDRIQNGWKNNLLDLADCGTDNHDASVREEDKPMFLQYPWLTVLQFQFAKDNRLQTMCSGVLIHPFFVLIAGHCICESCASYNLISVKLGDYNLSTDPDTENLFGEPLSIFSQAIPVEKVIRYSAPGNQSRYANDIALIKLSHAANQSLIHIRPICIPPEVEPSFRTHPSTVAGWKRAGENASIVQRESVQVVDSSRCEQQYGRIRVDLGVRESFLCVAVREESTNCANFFSGTPLQVTRSDGDGINRYYLRGLYAFGLARCHLNFTDVYVNVSYYGQWIKTVVESD